ncbi:hypothetical protein IQ13_0914 [Lacibacter cauensis]|uniref:Uncharacterized protein n=1 Tax=Lacibacter cauensis TaxID=510947 RepID=A0A562SYF3_9BACT|nr:DUF6326 family protein [Lacibacter cauensis]TWI85746.1 hypothetical protein IQ13_0914 [Lacibacter cauensis]
MKEFVLEEFRLHVRMKLSALWTGVMFCYIYGDYFGLYVPGKVQGLLNNDNMLNSPGNLFTAALLLAVPALMIFLSLMLKPKLCKALNIGVGIFFTLFTLAVGIASMPGSYIFYTVYSFMESIITSVIIYQAFKWPKISTTK